VRSIGRPGVIRRCRRWFDPDGLRTFWLLPSAAGEGRPESFALAGLKPNYVKEPYLAFASSEQAFFCRPVCVFFFSAQYLLF
jgi:hypothetical protein